MSLQIKAFLYEHRANRPKEIRRFAVDQDVSSSYDYLRRKVSSVFPNLGEDNFALQWKDSDGDFIWFNSDEELMQALGQLSEDVFKLYIKENSEKGGDDTPPRCRGRNFGGNFGPWGYSGSCPPRPPFGFPFQAPNGDGNPKFPGGFCPFNFQEQCQQQSSGAGQKQSSSKSGKENKEQSKDNASDYLQNMGNVVADFLSPFGIDVDINVEHKGKKTKCEGNKDKTDSEAPSTSDKPNTSEPSAPERSPGEPDWTFVKEDGKEKGSNDVEMDTEESRFDNALEQLIAMGFNDNGGWLSNLIKSCDNNIPKVLDAMQPKGGNK